MAGYEEIAGLEDVRLEDSWVLGVYESDASLSFDLETVLTERHPEWEPPKPGEMYCYRRTALIFPNVRGVEWVERGTRPATDATGEEDWGHIDTFTAEDGRYELTGDWGRVRFSSETPQLRAR
jgi:hypothetical protein